MWENNRDFTEDSRGRWGDGQTTQPTTSHLQFLTRHSGLLSPKSRQPDQPLPSSSTQQLVSPVSSPFHNPSFKCSCSSIFCHYLPITYPWLHNQSLQKAQLLVVPQLTEPCPPWRLFGHQFDDLNTFSDLLLLKLWVRYLSKYNEFSPRILMGEISPSPNIWGHLLTEFLPWNIKSDGIYLSASLPDLWYSCSHQDIPIHPMSKPNDSWLNLSIRTRKDSPYKTASRITGSYLECHILP